MFHPNNLFIKFPEKSQTKRMFFKEDESSFICNILTVCDRFIDSTGSETSFFRAILKQTALLRHIYSMKTFFLVNLLAAGLFITGCSEAFSPPLYSLKFPQIPEQWEGILGRPHWKIEWIDSEGHKKSLTVSETGNVKLNVTNNLSNALIAMPFWPEKQIDAGVFKPAGAIFPFDVSGENLILGWIGGVEAVLYYELASAYNTETSSSAVSRQPQYFDWPRFRLLFSDTSVNADFRKDPWLADLQNIALKIVQSGFDKRRLTPESRSSLKVSAGHGPWISTSPFSEPLFFEDSPVFPVRAITDTWVSKEGILRCNTLAWIFSPWPVR